MPKNKTQKKESKQEPQTEPVEDTEELTIGEGEAEAPAETPAKSKKAASDNPDVDLDKFMEGMEKFGRRTVTEEGKEPVVELCKVKPRQIREFLNRPIGAKYHTKLMNAAKTLVEQNKIEIKKFEGKRNFYFMLVE